MSNRAKASMTMSSFALLFVVCHVPSPILQTHCLVTRHHRKPYKLIGIHEKHHNKNNTKLVKLFIRSPYRSSSYSTPFETVETVAWRTVDAIMYPAFIKR
jgi:hypothetical protein